jgi:soluble cytochrome b562
MIAPNIPDLESTYRLLTNVHLMLLVLAGVIALAIGVLSVVSTRKANELIRAKDAQLALDLTAKDEQIARTYREAKRIETDADEKIAATNKEAIRIEIEANKKIVEARARADEANAQAQNAILAHEELRKQNLATESRLEEERRARLEMEEAIAPRLMEQSKSSQNLKPFAGMRALIECVNDFEARRTAGQIALTLQMAGWTLNPYPFRVGVDESGFFDGVDVVSNTGPRAEGDRSGEAAEVLVEQLKASKIQARRFPTINLPFNTLRIRVGLRPITYFWPKEIKDRIKEIEERIRQPEQKKPRE